ncbi:hypothetical protein [Anaeromyxobacter terrae]|uniref:hypothetical protein n=1 Tax=Anaeromyxobacter terrae TaxID=2925406 RepID=UPI001F5AB93C|nr:hypothetical protein [Anaeromyxobacter sp. SG22]
MATRSMKLFLSPRAAPDTWRDRWRLVRDLLGGALVLAVWLSLWSWVAVGVVGPLSRVTVLEGDRAAETL